MNSSSLYDTIVNYDTLQIGKNKTLIGLGKGAVLQNVELELNGSSNIILRNLAITDISPTVNRVGDGVRLWPSDHVWIDHCTFRNIGRAYVSIVSDYDKANNQELKVESGFITLSHNHFDGWVEGICGQRSNLVVTTCRSPALTLAHNWFQRSNNQNSYLFGPGTWGHLFNNYWSNIDHSGLGVACGGAALAQGNVFESTVSALYNNDDGVTDWTFCAVGYYGTLYAPMGTGDDEENLVDENSTLSLSGQSRDGGGLALPTRQSGHTFTVTVPITAANSESYSVNLLESPANVASAVKANAGVGHLF